MAKKKTEQLTPKQYATIRKISLSAVTDAIREGWQMPGVVKVAKFGRFYLLDVDRDQLKAENNK